MSEGAKKSRLFSSSSNWRDNADLTWLRDDDGGHLTNQFKHSADALAELAINTPGCYYFPMCYLYRHWLELILKRLLKDCEVAGLASTSKRQMKGHSLQSLWQACKNLLAMDWVEVPDDELQLMDDAIAELVEVAPTGQEFRYWKSIKGEKFIDCLPDRPSIVAMKEELDRFEHLYYWCSQCLDWMRAGEYR